MMNGIINVYKEKGYTSHDVVAKMRGILRMKKIGHTGTLDPDAEGVLPVCLGSGTRLCDMLTDRTKTYQTIMLLGRVTDTQDVSGQTISELNVHSTEEEIKSTALSFVGDYMQVPPMYSALKVHGKKLYELARAGKVIERDARPVEILSLSVDQIDLPRVTMTVSCSKGTYIRTLCHDIGEKLGCGGCMESLLRTRVGSFELKDSLKLGQIEQLRDAGQLDDYVVCVDQVFENLPPCYVKELFDRLVHNGNTLISAMFAEHSQLPEKLTMGQQIRVYDSKNTFIGIYEYQSEKERFLPYKIFGLMGGIES